MASYSFGTEQPLKFLTCFYFVPPPGFSAKYQRSHVVNHNTKKRTLTPWMMKRRMKRKFSRRMVISSRYINCCGMLKRKSENISPFKGITQTFLMLPLATGVKFRSVITTASGVNGWKFLIWSVFSSQFVLFSCSASQTLNHMLDSRSEETFALSEIREG